MKAFHPALRNAAMFAAVVSMLATGPILAAGGQVPGGHHCSGYVTNPDGTPAVGATAILYECLGDDRLIGAKEIRLGSDGTFDFDVPASPEPGTFNLLYIEGAAGTVIAEASAKSINLTLHPSTDLSFRLIDHAGKPIAGVRVTPASFECNGLYAPWNSAISKTLTVRTDDTGFGVFHGLPSDCKVSLHIHSDLYLQPGESLTPLSPTGASASIPDIQVQDGTAIVGKILPPTDGQTTDGIVIRLLPLGRTDSAVAITHVDGSYTIAGLAPGSYEIQAEMPSTLKSRWSIVPKVVDVALSSTPKQMDLPMVPCCVIRGTVTDKMTGKPLPNVAVVPTYTSVPKVHFVFGVPTDADGKYTLHVPPSDVKVTLVTPNAAKGDQIAKDVTAVGGQTINLDFQITHPGPWTIGGDVVDKDGHLVPNASIQATGDSLPERDTTSDDHGHFSFPSIDLGYSINARANTLASASPIKVSGPDTIKLVVVPGLLCRLRGTVHAGGRAVPGVEMILWDKSERVVDRATTDESGAFAFQEYAGRTYQLEAKMAHYGNAIADSVQPKADADFVLPTIDLVKADGAVAGTVVDRFGRPVPGAEVREESVDGLRSVTDAHGRFTLVGVPEGHSLLWVIAPGGRRGGANARAGDHDLLIKVMSDAEQTASMDEMRALEDTDPNLHGNGKDAALLLRQAETEAALTGKKIFLEFGASWCGDCYRFARFLENPQVKSIMARNYVILRIDVFENNNKGWENPGGLALYKEYGGTSTVPYWTVLDASGKQLDSSVVDGQNQGFTPAPISVDHFFRVLKATAPHISGGDYALLRRCIRHFVDD